MCSFVLPAMSASVHAIQVPTPLRIFVADTDHERYSVFVDGKKKSVPNYCNSASIPVLTRAPRCWVEMVPENELCGFALFCELMVSAVVVRKIGVICRFVPFDRMFSIEKACVCTYIGPEDSGRALFNQDCVCV